MNTKISFYSGRLKRSLTLFSFMILLNLLLLTPSVSGQANIPDSIYNQAQTPWISAYLASWNHFAPPGGNWGHVRTEHIDWQSFTHLIYFALRVEPDGTLTEIKAYNNMSPDRINAIVRAGHQNRKPVLISLGGWGNHEGFSSAIQPSRRSSLIANIKHLIQLWGFDGVDLDMEPIKSTDVQAYRDFVTELHASLQSVKTPLLERPLLTAATSWQPELFAELQEYFDQINLMTYDFSGAWGGWTTWHNSAIFDGGNTFPGSSRKLPSVDQKVESFLKAGVNPDKLGFGIDFYGYVWNGVSRPNQNWNRWSPPRVEDNVSYHKIMDTYYQPGYYRWDDKAGAAFLQIEDRKEPLFISYDSPQTVQAKMQYLRDKKLGGVILWELSGAMFPGQPERKELIESLKQPDLDSAALQK